MKQITIVIFTLIVLCSLGAAQSKAPSKGQISDAILSAKPENLDAAVKHIQDDLSATEERLIAIVKNRQRYTGAQAGVPIAAIEVLGRLRSKAAVPVLVDAIFFAYREPVTMSGREVDRMFPVGRALIAIGDWYGVATALGEVKDERQRRVLSGVVLDILGRPLATKLFEDMGGYSYLSDEQRTRYTEAAGWLKPQPSPAP